MNEAGRGGFLQLVEVFDLLELRYMVSGSAGSGVHGEARMTRDIDMVVQMSEDDTEPLVEELKAEFYIDASQIRDALRYRRAFNIIHFQSAFKFDIFPLTRDSYQQEQFSRRRYERSSMFGPEPVEFAVISPEDSVLSKLERYCRGGEVSEQQWNDFLGVLAVQGDRLDLAYMCKWAAHLKIPDLLEQALTEKH